MTASVSMRIIAHTKKADKVDKEMSYSVSEWGEDKKEGRLDIDKKCPFKWQMINHKK